ncbi:hypothetical protein KR044_002249, partial [Drosophila immigrans]
RLLKMCRICGRSNICEKSINLFESSNRKLLRHIQMLTGLRLLDSQDAPDSICFCCQSDLKLAMSFRRLCIKTQKKWQPLVEVHEDSSLSEQEPTRNSPVVPILQKCNEVYFGSDSDEEPQQTVQVLIQESKIHNDVNAAAAQEHDHLDVDYIMQTQSDVDTDGDSGEKSESDEKHFPTQSINVRSTKEHRKLLKAKQEIAIYICELCGTHVNTKASFDRHIRKHTGERPFACDECEARFLSAAELRSHGLSHTGEQPFPCRYCDRRYVSYMGRLKHERIHTNERPFVCAECGKAFTNAYILKNHMLVHTGERFDCSFYRCDLCDRAFSRPTHLKTHYRSNTHKQNVEKSSTEQVQMIKSDKLQTQAALPYTTTIEPQVELISAAEV